MSAKQGAASQNRGRATAYSCIIESCVWTCAEPRRFLSTMDDDDTALIRQLCTRAGCIMEDSSVVALIWDDGLTLEARLAKLSDAANDIRTLVAAAKALMPR
jgi:hypothetical protein